MRNVVFTLLILCCAAASLYGQSSTEMMRADSLFNNYHQQEALDAYNEILSDDSDNFRALWHTSLLFSRMGNEFEDDDMKKEYFNKAKERAQRALDIDPDHTQSNFVMAVAMGRMALIVGAKERVAASRDIKKYAERALQADSSNAGAWHVLGRWHYEISDLNFAERLAANVLFGGVPEGASNENAARHIEQAIELNPDMVLYYYDLAKAYQELDREEDAISTCREALELPSHAPDDDKAKRDCQELIEDLD